MNEPEHEPVGRAAPDLSWITPGNHGAPADALLRIGFICAEVNDLFGAMFAVLGTHQAVSHHILAAALKQCRSDLADLSRDDVSALLTSAWNGGRSGFDAVMRSRRKGLRKTSALPWAQE